MRTVNASEFQRRVGEFSDIARREPVTVIRHGRASVVLLAAEDYQRLKLIEGRTSRAVRTADLPASTLDAMSTADLSHLPVD